MHFLPPGPHGNRAHGLMSLQQVSNRNKKSKQIEVASNRDAVLFSTPFIRERPSRESPEFYIVGWEMYSSAIFSWQPRGDTGSTAVSTMPYIT